MASPDAKCGAISQPYRFEVDLISEQPDLDLQSLLHQRAFLAFSPDGLGIHGLIYQVAQGESGNRLTRYKLSIVPQLSYLALRTNQRIFQHMTMPQIIAQVLQEHGIALGGYQFQLGPTVYPKRDYCVQYDGSDLHFVQRLCEEEGIHYHFQHSEQGHVLMFGDDQSAFGKLGEPTAYLQDNGMTADEPVIKHFAVRLETRTSRITRRDYDFEQPRLLLEPPSRRIVIPRPIRCRISRTTTTPAALSTVHAASTSANAASSATAPITDWPKAVAISQN